MSDYQTLDFTIDNHLAQLTLDRPDAANGINPQMAEELMQVITACEKHDDIRAMLITGNGKLFCAGGDVNSFAALGDQAPVHIRRLMINLHAAIAGLVQLPFPVVIAVNGPVAGAGFGLTCAGDIVYASPAAHFSMAYTAIGLTPDAGATWFLPRLIGLRRTQELILTNRRLNAEEARDWGIITEVVDADSLVQTALATAQKLAHGPTLAFSKVKTLLQQSENAGLETQMENEARSMTAMLKSTDGKAGIQAFTDKQKPAFNGH